MSAGRARHSAEPTARDAPSGTPGGAGFWISAAIGWAVIAFAVRGLLREPDWAGNPDGFARFLLTSVLVHDVVLAPAVVGLGVAVARVVPGSVRAPVQGGLIASGVAILVAWPFLRGYGVAATNPTALPWNYGWSLAIVLGAIWLAVAAGATISKARRPSPT